MCLTFFGPGRGDDVRLPWAVAQTSMVIPDDLKLSSAERKFRASILSFKGLSLKVRLLNFCKVYF